MGQGHVPDLHVVGTAEPSYAVRRGFRCSNVKSSQAGAPRADLWFIHARPGRCLARLLLSAGRFSVPGALAPVRQRGEAIKDARMSATKEKDLTKRILALLLFFGTVSSIAVVGESSLARFEGGIGVMPVRLTGAGSAASPTPNVVRGANPGSVPWVIGRLTVDVKSDGRISVDGRGLLIAGSNAIGTSAGQTVRARLFCGPASTAHDSGLVPLDPAGDFEIVDTLVPPPPDPCTSSLPSPATRPSCGPASTATAHDSVLVPLSPEGDFRIEDTLNPLPPDPCTDSVLLILNSSTTAGGVWLAAGIPKQ